MPLTYDYLIVGAGFTGAILAERIAAGLDRTVLVIDRRDHIGGNAYDHADDHGVRVHRYGPHIFHTNSVEVWRYLSRFTDWRPYEHRVLAEIDGKRVPIPFNLNTLHALLPAAEADSLERRLVAAFGAGARVPILRMMESDDPELCRLADFIYEKVFYGYTTKQWGLTPRQLDPSVTGRVPVLVGRDDRYFHDTYQAMPAAGYGTMFARILDHPNITVRLGTEFRQVETEERFDRVICTGPIDAFFDWVHGELPYRSLWFELRHFDEDRHQETGTVNFPNDHAYTRITEFKHLTGQRIAGTTVAVEYPQPYSRGENEPYYPIPMESNRALYSRYLDEAARLGGRVLFAGRLGDYKYYNMDQAAARALQVFRRDIAA